MEFIINKQIRIPDSETSKRLLTSLCRARLEIVKINLESEEISAKFEQELREQKLKRVQRSLANLQH